MAPANVRAGGGPENVVVVVNPRSEDSRAIADHYVRLRHIPACNVVPIEWDPKADTTNVDAFRDKILKPLMEEIKSRGLEKQIDCIAYSSDFPWRIDAASDAKKTWKPFPPPKYLRPMGSITGLTCLYRAVLAGDAMGYVGLTNNRYALPTMIRKKDEPTPSRAFSASQGYGPRGEEAEDGELLMMSVMLGVTTGRGNSVEEVRDYLSRSAKADGTRPKGTIYFCKNGDVRSRTRDPLFADAVSELESLGVKAMILEGRLPPKKNDVLGAMIGTASFDWKGSGSTILPGAICEHLTSFGGIMTKNAGQTPLSEFLRHGAAGASGTITEPYAIRAKFPSPSIHVHYARGCTLAEAFYQSVTGPYMLLIVGDPLCRPWANIPEVTVANLPPGGVVKDAWKIEPSVKFAGKGQLDRLELFVDGVRRGVFKNDSPIVFDASGLKPGQHELRVVAIEAGSIQSQGRWIGTIRHEK